MSVPTFPARCEINGHQYFAQGWCYALGADMHGPYALVVYDRSGEVRVVRLNDGLYSLTLERTC